MLGFSMDTLDRGQESVVKGGIAGRAPRLTRLGDLPKAPAADLTAHGIRFFTRRRLGKQRSPEIPQVKAKAVPHRKALLAGAVGAQVDFRRFSIDRFL